MINKRRTTLEDPPHKSSELWLERRESVASGDFSSDKHPRGKGSLETVTNVSDGRKDRRADGRTDEVLSLRKFDDGYGSFQITNCCNFKRS